MSISLMSLAWKTNLPPTLKLALLAMCDWANDEGGSLHPSVQRVAERLSCSSRQAQRVLHTLINDGWISIVGNEHGGAPGQSRRYTINIARLTQTGDMGVTGDIGDTGDTGVTGDKLSRVTSMSQTGDIHVARRVTSMSQTGDMGVTLSTIEPPIEPPEEPPVDKRTRCVRTSKPSVSIACPDDVDPQVFSDWIAVRKAKRAGPVTPTVLSGIRAEALKAGISLSDAIEHCCVSGWQGFRADWYLRSQMPVVAANTLNALGKSAKPNNPQIALEEENRRVAREWLAQFEQTEAK